MKLLKQMICKMWNIFNLPKFSQTSEIKIPKCKTLEIIPTKEFQKQVNEYLEVANFNNVKVFINDKEIKEVNNEK